MAKYHGFPPLKIRGLPCILPSVEAFVKIDMCVYVFIDLCEQKIYNTNYFMTSGEWDWRGDYQLVLYTSLLQDLYKPLTVVDSIKYILNFIRTFKVHSQTQAPVLPLSHKSLSFLKYEFSCHEKLETQTLSLGKNYDGQHGYDRVSRQEDTHEN